MQLYPVFLLSIAAAWTADALHLQGTFRTGQYFSFLAKFGFRKTDRHDHENTLGYIYGNVTTATKDLTHRGTLVVVDRSDFLSYYGNRTESNRQSACQLMFSGINRVAFDSSCNPNGTQDFLRNIPCTPGKLCEDEDKPNRVVKGNQFTYTVRDLHQARFWYISMVSCYRIGEGKDCKWKDSVEEDIAINYDIWLVNGNPAASSHNFFEYQFSFEQQGSLERVLLFFVLYLVLACLQVYAALQQKHLVTRLFTAALTLQLLSFLWTITHLAFFAWDGVGVPTLGIVGDVTYMLSQSLFMLLLLLLAKGWAITRTELTWKPVLFCIWLVYSCIQILLYVWNMTEVDVIEEIDEYQTYPGWISLCFRLVVTAWFLTELRSTMIDENDHRKLRFYLHFGAGLLCWFVYLPVVALIALQVSALWRQKFILGISSCADFLAYAIIAHLLWPTRSQQYFQLQSELDPGDELEELNEAPHNVQPPPPRLRKLHGNEDIHEIPMSNLLTPTIAKIFQDSTMKSTSGGGGGAKFSRWLSQISDPRDRRNSDNNNGQEDDDDDPWGDRLGRLDLPGDIKMGFEDDFHLTLIPNFLHDSDAYVASLENKLERLHHISRNVSPKEMLTLMAKARAMRLKNAELNVGSNQGTADSHEESDYAGAFSFWTALIVPLSRRLFPRLPLSKEETQGLLKYDFLHMQCEDEARAVAIAAPNTAESSKPRPTETPQDTGREPQHRNSEEQPIIVFESPEANELQIPKGWVEDEIQQKIQAETCTLPDDTIVAPANRSALSLNTNGGTVPQEASTLTSITSPSRRSEDALYHFAHFMSSATSTMESTRLECPSESRLILLQERLSRSKLPSKERVPFMSLYGASIAHMQQSLNMVDLEIASTLAQGKSFEILQEPSDRECRVIVSRSSPSLKMVTEPQKFQAECQQGSRARQYHSVRESPGEEEGVENGNREQDCLGQRQEGQDGQRQECTGQECTGQLDIELGELEEYSPEQNSHAYEESGPGKHVGYQDATQNKIIHETVIASSSQEDMPGVEQSTPVVKAEEKVVLLECQKAPSRDLMLQEITVASSSSCERLPMEQGLWAAGSDSAAFQVPSAEDVVPHMSSLVRASEDEDEQSSVQPGSRGGYGQSSTMLQTLSKASEGTNDSDRESEQFSHYSDPQSNLYGTESGETVTKEEGQAPMIRMFGSIPQDIHTTLKTSFCSWVQHKRLESLETAHDAVSSTGSLPAVGFEGTEHSRLLFKVYGEETKASSTTSKNSEPITSKASSPFSEVGTILEEQPNSALSGMTTTSLMSFKSTDTATVVPMDENRPAVHPPGAVVATSSAFKSRKRSVHWFENCVQDADGQFVERSSDYPSPQHEDNNPGTRKKASKSFSCDLVGKAAEIHKHVEQEMVATHEPQPPKADSRKIAECEELSTEHQASLTVLEDTMAAPAPGTYADEQRTSSTQDKSKPVADSGQEESNGKRPNTDTTVLHCSEIMYHGHFSFLAGSCKTSSTAHSSLKVVRTVRINASKQFNSSLPKRSATSLPKSDCAFNKSFLLPSAVATPNKQKLTQNLIIKYGADMCSSASRSAPRSKIEGRTKCSALSFTPSCHPSAIIEQSVEEVPELHKVARKTNKECSSTAIEQKIPAVPDMPPGPTALALAAKSQEFVGSMAEEDAAIKGVVRRGATIEHKVDYELAEPFAKEGKRFTNTEEDLLEVKPPVEDHGSVTPIIDGCISVKVTQQDSSEFKTATQENGPARAIASKSIQPTDEGHALDKLVAEACKLSEVTQDNNRSKTAAKNDKFATYTADNSLPSPAEDAAPVTQAAEDFRQIMLAQDNDGNRTTAERSSSVAPMTAKGYPFQSASHHPTPLISTGEIYVSNAPTDGDFTVRMSTADCIAQTVMISKENMFGKPTTENKEAEGASSEKAIAKSAPVERGTVSLGATNDAVATSDCCCKQLIVARLHRASLVADALAKHAAGRRASTKSANADLSIAALETRERATDRLAVPKQKTALSATEKSAQTMTEVEIGTFSSAEKDLSVQEELGRSSVGESTAGVAEDSGGNAIIVGQSVLWTNGEGTAALIENNDMQERGTLCVHLQPGPLLSRSDLREGRSSSLLRRPSNLSAYEILYDQSISDISQ